MKQKCLSRKLTVLYATVCGLSLFAPERSDAALFATKSKFPKAEEGIVVYSRPEDQVVRTNGTAVFTVIAESAKGTNQPLFYQWVKPLSLDDKNPSILSGATGPTLVLSNVTVTDVGFYACRVSRNAKMRSFVTAANADCDAPGGRLFVYTGTNTSITGPYQSGSGNKSCVGPYIGKVTFKVPGTQGTWFTRPAGTTSCTATDIVPSGYSYVAVVQVVDTWLWSTCGVSTITFPTMPSPYKYQFTTYIKSGTPPPRLELDLNWTP